MNLLPLKQFSKQSRPPKLFCSRRPSYFRTQRVHCHVRDSLVVDEFETDSPMDDYNIYAQLGAGEFGQTLRVSRDCHFYALKKTQDSTYARAGMFAQLLSRCETVPRIYESWSECDELFISMDLADCSLTELVETCAPSEQLAWAVLADVGRAILAVHRAGYYHLDVKMDNILVKSLLGSDIDESARRERDGEPPIVGLEDGPPSTSRYRAPLERMGLNRANLIDNVVFMLSDFGNACKTSSGHATLGDSRYCYNEFIYSHVPSPYCDSYALGVTIFELCTYVELPVEGDFFAMFRQDPFLLISDWPFSDYLARVVKALLYGYELLDVMYQWMARLQSRMIVYAAIDAKLYKREYRFAYIVIKQRRKARPKDTALLNACLRIKRKAGNTDIPLDDISFGNLDDFEIPDATMQSGELLAGGLELSF